MCFKNRNRKIIWLPRSFIKRRYIHIIELLRREFMNFVCGCIWSSPVLPITAEVKWRRETDTGNCVTVEEIWRTYFWNFRWYRVQFHWKKHTNLTFLKIMGKRLIQLMKSESCLWVYSFQFYNQWTDFQEI